MRYLISVILLLFVLTIVRSADRYKKKASELKPVTSELKRQLLKANHELWLVKNWICDNATVGHGGNRMTPALSPETMDKLDRCEGLLPYLQIQNGTNFYQICSRRVFKDQRAVSEEQKFVTTFCDAYEGYRQNPKVMEMIECEMSLYDKIGIDNISYENGFKKRINAVNCFREALGIDVNAKLTQELKADYLKKKIRLQAELMCNARFLCVRSEWKARGQIAEMKRQFGKCFEIAMPEVGLKNVNLTAVNDPKLLCRTLWRDGLYRANFWATNSEAEGSSTTKREYYENGTKNLEKLIECQRDSLTGEDPTALSRWQKCVNIKIRMYLNNQ